MIDREWRCIKDLLPDWLSAKDEEKRGHAMILIRSAQWKRMTASMDQWEEFCSTVQRLRPILHTVVEEGHGKLCFSQDSETPEALSQARTSSEGQGQF